MLYSIVSKSFAVQFCLNFHLCHEMFEYISSYLSITNNQYCIDILLNKKNTKLTYHKENIIPFLFSIPYHIIDYDYNFLIKTLNTFLFLFKRDIISILQTNYKKPYIIINDNNQWIITSNLIQNNTILINTVLYKHKYNNDACYVLIQLNWKTTKLIYHILYKKVWEYVINYYQLFNNLNERVNIEYTSKIKNNNFIKGKKKDKKKQILNFLKLFINNFYIKLANKYGTYDNTHNFFDISGINKTHLHLNLYIKLFNNTLSTIINNNDNNDNDIITLNFNNNIKNIIIDNLYYII